MSNKLDVTEKEFEKILNRCTMSEIKSKLNLEFKQELVDGEFYFVRYYDIWFFTKYNEEYDRFIDSQGSAIPRTNIKEIKEYNNPPKF